MENVKKMCEILKISCSNLEEELKTLKTQIVTWKNLENKLLKN